MRNHLNDQVVNGVIALSISLQKNDKLIAATFLRDKINKFVIEKDFILVDLLITFLLQSKVDKEIINAIMKILEPYKDKLPAWKESI